MTIVFNDGYFGNVRRIQKNRYGGRYFASDLTNPDYQQLAGAFGIGFACARDPGSLAGVLRDAVAASEPVLVEVPVGEFLPVASDPRGHPPPRADCARGAPADRAEARVTDEHMDKAMTKPCVTTRHAIDLPGGRLEYQARAGTVRVGRDDGSPLADVFYLAYRAESGATRPVTFAFNGGPGSASLWLNVGGFGPRRAPTLTPHPTPPAPYAFGDNPHTLLAVSDLVFLDAVGTGFSRLAGDGRPDEVWGVDQDVEVFARAILRYLTMTGSWQAPRYLFGESYGTSRAAALVYRLQNLGADFNGVIMLSTLLNWATTQPGLDQGYINLLPSYAAAAWYHGKASPPPSRSPGSSTAPASSRTATTPPRCSRATCCRPRQQRSPPA